MKLRSRLDGSHSIQDLSPDGVAQHPADHTEVIHLASLIIDVKRLEEKTKETPKKEKALFYTCNCAVTAP